MIKYIAPSNITDAELNGRFASMALSQHSFIVMCEPKRLLNWMKNCTISKGDVSFPNQPRSVAVYNEMDSLQVGNQELHKVMRNVVKKGWWPLSNVTLAWRIRTQKEADANLPEFIQCPAVKRLIYIEPTEKININTWLKIRWPAAEQPGCLAVGMPCRDIVDYGSYQSQACNCFSRGWCIGIDEVVIIGVSCDCGRIEHGRCHAACPSKDERLKANTEFIRKQCLNAGVKFNIE